jgi:8-oxo-dGTP diphosphatase
VDVEVDGKVGESVHAYPTVTIRLVGYLCSLAAGDPTAAEHDDLRWLGRDDLGSVEWAAADVPLLEPLRRHLGP